ncbi:MAG TPA: molybdopterin converting factor subunit 1 [Polyangiaceae bacterium]
MPSSDSDSVSLSGALRSVQVLYFAALRDLTGLAEEQLDLPAEVETVRGFVDYLQLVRPALAGRLASVRVALDEAFAKDSDALAGARVIALIPPVAGG